MAGLKVLSLFSGCGGLDYGFHHHPSFQVVRSYDAMPHAVETYNLNFPGTAEVRDVTTLTELPFHPDVIVGGPPCQDFSVAGKRELGERANLTLVYTDLICKYLPDYFVMENVPSIRTVGKEIYDQVIDRFHNASYGLTTRVITMSEYGVPQQRKRLVILGVKDGRTDECSNLLDKQKCPVKSIREYLENIGVDLGKPHIYRHPRLNCCRGVYSLDELYPTVRGCIRRIPPSFRSHPNDSTDRLEDIFVPDWRTAAILQTFPPDFQFLEQNNSLIVGNAVPPMFSFALANVIAEHSLGKSIEESL